MSNPLNLIFTCHGIVSGFTALQTLLFTQTTGFLFNQTLDTTSLLCIQFYGATLACLAVISLLSRNMPNMLPCKRATACGFIVYHGIMTLILIQNRNEVIMHKNASLLLSIFHGLQAFILYAWYTATASQVKAFLKENKK
ncbi:hypothetical protein CU097_009059 [Rhizopus azygosporus]|uniref:Uncharacterized protein n=1 Tax=Rhizopus azygosporus TaxID=86630 RepID=A0A367JMU2_RHIAZ|nr:hypothetical protein CU097_009059 [Rhizopus azygosporus]